LIVDPSTESRNRSGIGGEVADGEVDLVSLEGPRRPATSAGHAGTISLVTVGLAIVVDDPVAVE
jgi:hypothetical protein